MSNVIKFEFPKTGDEELAVDGKVVLTDPTLVSTEVVDGSAAIKPNTEPSSSVVVVVATEQQNATAHAPAIVQVITEETKTATTETTTAETVAPKEAETPLGTFFKFLFLTLSSSVALVWYTIASIGRYFIRHPLSVLLNLALLVVLALVVVTGSEIHSKMILGQISDRTVDAVIDGSRFTRDYDAEEVNRNGARDFLRVGAPKWTQREAVRAILFHSRKAGLTIEDQAVLLAVADIESGFNPLARAPTTTACGLFQFVKRTGEIFGLSQSECMDPWRNAEAGVAHYVYNYERRVAPQVRDLRGTEKLFRVFELSYYMHHDGPESVNPSNDVKAIILNGTHFLFRAYHSLLEESESQQRAPTFAEQFSGNFWKMLDRVKVFFSHWSLYPVLEWIRGEGSSFSGSGDDGYDDAVDTSVSAPASR